MKKVYCFLMLCLWAVCSTTIVSCSDDDVKIVTNPLVGTWVNTDDYDNLKEELAFTSAFTVTWKKYEVGITKEKQGTYSVNGKQLLMLFVVNGVEDNEQFTFEVKGDMMELTDSEGTIVYSKLEPTEKPKNK